MMMFRGVHFLIYYKLAVQVRNYDKILVKQCVYGRKL